MQSNKNPKSSNSFLQRAIVVDNHDLLKLGRVKARVFTLDGEQDGGIPDEDLRWYSPVVLFGAYNSGSIVVPEVGSIIFVTFENGELEKPLYLGQSFGVGINHEKELSNTVGTPRAQKLKTPEIPVEFVDEDNEIVHKSPKGNRILSWEKDGHESIYMEDSLGQTIGMSSPLTEEGSKDSAHMDNQNMVQRVFNNWKALAKKAVMFFRSLSNSIIRISNDQTITDIDLQSRSPSSPYEASINLHSGEQASFKVVVNNQEIYEISIDPSGIWTKGANSTIHQTSKEITIVAPDIKVKAKNFDVEAESVHVETNNELHEMVGVYTLDAASISFANVGFTHYSGCVCPACGGCGGSAFSHYTESKVTFGNSNQIHRLPDSRPEDGLFGNNKVTHDKIDFNKGLRK